MHMQITSYEIPCEGCYGPSTPFFTRMVPSRDGGWRTHLILAVLPYDTATKTRTEEEMRERFKQDMAILIVNTVLDTGADCITLRPYDAAQILELSETTVRNALDGNEGIDGFELGSQESAGGEAPMLIGRADVALFNECTRKWIMLEQKHSSGLELCIADVHVSLAGRNLLRSLNMNLLGARKENTLIVPFAPDVDVGRFWSDVW